MSRKNKTYHFSKLFLWSVLIVYFANYLLAGSLFPYLSLDIPSITDNSEFWRIFTFPFVSENIEGIILFIITFYFIAPRLEAYLLKSSMPLLTLLIISLQGLLTTVVFWDMAYSFSGMEGVSFFNLTLFFGIAFSKRFITQKIALKRASLFVSLISLTWLTSLAIHSLISGFDIFYQNGISALYGIVSGLIVFAEIRIIKSINDKKEPPPAPIDIPKPEELSLALIEAKNFLKFNQSLKEEDTRYEFTHEMLTEDRLNEILDKMLAQGKESLSFEELSFLEEYSKK